MDYNYNEKPALSRCVLAALFSGLIATCIIEVYNIAYRGITHYNPSSIINVSSIIFGTLIPCMAAGVIFYFLTFYVKGGIHIFRFLFLALSIWLGSVALSSHYGGNLPMYQGFRGLLLGAVVILAIFIIVFIPYFFKHDKAYLD
jgi:hypothetical protein